MAIDPENLKEYEKICTELETIGIENKLIEKKRDIEELQKQASAPDFWSDTEKAQEVSAEIGTLEKSISQLEKIGALKQDIEFILQNETEAEQFSEELNKYLTEFMQLTKEFKLEQLLSGKFDKSSAIFNIFSGQGGTEADDWTEMLMRMYLRYFTKKEWTAEILNKVDGTEAGVSSVSIKVTGPYAYGHLKTEHGTHRLVRISPFNSQGLRQTSFAGVEVTPLVKDVNDIEIKDEDIEFSAVRSSGAGGQNVNKVATSVRIKHIPTGITVTCSTNRSQLQNRNQAMEMLQSKLAFIEEEKRREAISKEKGDVFKASWGNQIRNYVLHPYKLVKDLRTKVETDKVEEVLDGNIENFVSAGIIYLS